MKKPKKRYNVLRFPIIGKYSDTLTKASVEVIYFVDDIGEQEIRIGNLPTMKLKTCRFQLRAANVKSKRKFHRKLQTFLDFSAGWGNLEKPPIEGMPTLCGLLKLRKGKKRILVLIRSADQFFKSKVINVIAVIIDNLMYLDLLGQIEADKKS